MKDRKRKILCLLMTVCFLAGMLTACSIEKENRTKLRDIEFTVLDDLDTPEELKTQIEKCKSKEFRLTYADQGYLYIARGYGEQETSGYSIIVDSCYEADNVICIQTTLLGPKQDEKVQEATTCPYVVVKMEYIDKDVVFD